jgi:large conductance mechanosensitive channel
VLKELRDFILRGNVLDLAVAVVMGAAFGAITTSLVDDILMPIIGVLLGGVDFTTLSWTFNGVQINYGNFIQSVVNFVIIAVAMFFVLKAANTVMRKKVEAPVPPAPTVEEKLLTEIRDLLKTPNRRVLD